MLRFNQFVSKKKFVGLFFNDETNKLLRKWALDQGFDLASNFSGQKIPVDDFDFHTTIFFTTSRHSTTTGEFIIPSFQLQIDHFELLGEDHNIPVAKINPDNSQLQLIRHRFVDIGYRDAWPDFKPHISLSYNYNGTPDIASLTVPDFPIVVSNLKVSDQKED